ncbi:MAG: (2Fe-2S)-binding protein [Terracidiphilus sp.]
MREPAHLLTLTVNGASVTVAPGTTVAAAVLMTGATTRKSASGAMRGPLCGMGICFECRVMIDGKPHLRSCQIPCALGMEVRTP